MELLGHLNATLVARSEGVEDGHGIGVSCGEGERGEGGQEEDVVGTHFIQALVDPVP